MYSTSSHRMGQHSIHNSQNNSTVPVIPDWEQGNVALNLLIKGDKGSTSQTTESSEKTLDELSHISPIGINFHLNSECLNIPSNRLLQQLLTDLHESLHRWSHRPLGNLYWNRKLIEKLDEGNLTELAFNLSHSLKAQQKPDHIAELSIDESCLSKLALIRGLGVNKVIFSLPIFRGDTPLLASHLIHAGKRVQELGFKEISIRLPYDIDSVGAHELLGLFLDLPQFGPHELFISPVFKSGKKLYSLWGDRSALMAKQKLQSSTRKWLGSQGYQAIGYDRLVLSSTKISDKPQYFDPMGQLTASTPEFVGVGPGALSRLQSNKMINHSLFSLYSEHLSMGIRPHQIRQKLNKNFVLLEPLLTQFLQSLNINLGHAAKLLGRKHIINFISLLDDLPQGFWFIEKNELYLSDGARDWLPIICKWLIDGHAISNNKHAYLWH